MSQNRSANDLRQTEGPSDAPHMTDGSLLNYDRSRESSSPPSRFYRENANSSAPRTLHIGVLHVRTYIRKHISRPISMISLLTSIINMLLCVAIFILSLIVYANFDHQKCSFGYSISIPALGSLYGGIGVAICIVLIGISIWPNQFLSVILLFVITAGVFVTTPIAMDQLKNLNELNNNSDQCRRSLYFDMQSSVALQYFIRRIERSYNCCGYHDSEEYGKHLPSSCCSFGYKIEIVRNGVVDGDYTNIERNCEKSEDKPLPGCWIEFLRAISEFIRDIVTVLGVTFYLFGISAILVFVDSWIAYHTSLSSITTEQEIRI